MGEIIPLSDCWRKQAEQLIIKHWGSPVVVSRGRIHHAAQLPGFLLLEKGEITGLITYEILGDQCELVSLDSTVENLGNGTALVEHVIAAARAKGCSRLWLITTNDNLRAIRFYQRRGFTMAALHVDAVAEARRLKPEIPMFGWEGIPIKDEVEFELIL